MPARACRRGARASPSCSPLCRVRTCAGVQEIKSFNEWLGTLPHRHKIVVAGNHDLLFDHTFYNASWKDWVSTKEDCGPGTARALLTNATAYLEHEEVRCTNHDHAPPPPTRAPRLTPTFLRPLQLVIDGVRFFGSPYQPVRKGRRMAFQYGPGEARRLWASIPHGLDVLCTHGPPKGILDRILTTR